MSHGHLICLGMGGKGGECKYLAERRKYAIYWGWGLWDMSWLFSDDTKMVADLNVKLQKLVHEPARMCEREKVESKFDEKHGY